MKKQASFIVIATIAGQVLSGGANVCNAAEWPQLLSGNKDSDCQAVLKGAKQAFQSNIADIDSAGDAVRAKDKDLIVWPKINNSGADSPPLGYDEKFIDYKEPDGGGKVYVQKEPMKDVRFVVRQTPFNWQGDWFYISTMKTADKPAKIIELIPQANLRDKDPLPKGLHMITNGTWQSPWLFRNGNNKHVVAVDTQHPAEFFANWDVYTATSDGNGRCICKIAFRPPVKDAFQLMPKGPLLQLARLLDDMIGHPAPGSEGTMNQTAGLRITVENMWGNVLLRPWALLQPSSSRQEIETNLKTWSKGSKACRKQYDQLKALYPQAETALSQYYEQERKVPHAQATSDAKKNLDVAFRTHFRY